MRERGAAYRVQSSSMSRGAFIHPALGLGEIRKHEYSVYGPCQSNIGLYPGTLSPLHTTGARSPVADVVLGV